MIGEDKVMKMATSLKRRNGHAAQYAEMVMSRRRAEPQTLYIDEKSRCRVLKRDEGSLSCCNLPCAILLIYYSIRPPHTIPFPLRKACIDCLLLGSDIHNLLLSATHPPTTAAASFPSPSGRLADTSALLFLFTVLLLVAL